MLQSPPSLIDERGIIRKALKLLPLQLRGRFLEVFSRTSRRILLSPSTVL